jgi:ABC-type sugar transport system, permease component
MKLKINKRNTLTHVVLIIGAIIMIVPFLWMALTSVKTLGESIQMPPKIFPSQFYWENYPAVMGLLPFAKFYINTILMIVGRVIGSVLFSAMAAYACARLNFPGKNLFFGLVLFQMMIPGQLFIIPQFLIVQKLGLLNTVSALVIPGVVSAFGTFLLRQFFMGLPKDLEEAAKLDGCTIWQTFIRLCYHLHVLVWLL